MFDVWMGDINVMELVLIVSIVMILPIQLLLCFKVKNLAIRLLPILISFALTIMCGFMALITPGWDGLGWVFLLIYTAIWTLTCGIGWAIWAAVRYIKFKKDK